MSKIKTTIDILDNNDQVIESKTFEQVYDSTVNYDLEYEVVHKTNGHPLPRPKSFPKL